MNSGNRYEDTNYPLSALTSRIIAYAAEVHKTLGPGFEEVFYQRALHRELSAAALEASRGVEIEVRGYFGISVPPSSTQIPKYRTVRPRGTSRSPWCRSGPPCSSAT